MLWFLPPSQQPFLIFSLWKSSGWVRAVYLLAEWDGGLWRLCEDHQAPRLLSRVTQYYVVTESVRVTVNARYQFGLSQTKDDNHETFVVISIVVAPIQRFKDGRHHQRYPENVRNLRRPSQCACGCYLCLLTWNDMACKIQRGGEKKKYRHKGRCLFFGFFFIHFKSTTACHVNAPSIPPYFTLF